MRSLERTPIGFDPGDVNVDLGSRRRCSPVTLIELTVRSEPNVVGLVRELVGEISECVCGDADIASQAAIALHELLDNATRYATDGEANVRIELRERSPRIEIRTRNRVRDEDARRVAAHLERLRAIGDPLTFYIGLMGRNKSREGGLGLGRVAAESEMTLEMTYNADVLEVAAIHSRGAA
jgi:anti-sigma regulatory factor (Ser/Thr protein kinase)